MKITLFLLASAALTSPVSAEQRGGASGRDIPDGIRGRRPQV
jgi:hypothetical protein